MVSFMTHRGLVAPHVRSNLIISLVSKRLATTSSNEHHQWPKTLHPTPYEVLNISSKNFDKHKLRTQYYMLAKVYHPDISSKKELKDHKGETLSINHKNERFKLLSDAYLLLKDPRKKAAYDHHRIGWGSTGNRIFEDAFASQRSAHKQQPFYATHEYWNASNWEDYQNLHKNQGMEGAEQNQNKMKVLVAIVCFIIASATLQGWYVLDNVEKSVLEHKRRHDVCEQDLELAYTNYGFDSTKMSRIRRFLWFRTFGLYRKKEHLDESSKQNERIIREVIGDVD